MLRCLQLALFVTPIVMSAIEKRLEKVPFVIRALLRIKKGVTLL